MPSKDDDLLAYIINKEAYQELYDAINILNAYDREILIRKYFFEEKPSGIAKKMGVSVKEIENRLYRGKEKLKKYLIKKEVLSHE